MRMAAATACKATRSVVTGRIVLRRRRIASPQRKPPFSLFARFNPVEQRRREADIVGANSSSGDAACQWRGDTTGSRVNSVDASVTLCLRVEWLSIDGEPKDSHLSEAALFLR